MAHRCLAGHDARSLCPSGHPGRPGQVRESAHRGSLPAHELASAPRSRYLFANKRATRMKVPVHEGIGMWPAARRLNTGRFTWASEGANLSRTREQFEALVLGLPWRRVGYLQGR
ncbi:IS66 family insertion sequence element accessory protein TnpB [Ramlibacter sp. AN1015]|uniref:IS66 family insertion sequence element accessory protein TnpB n=1 Tax=Ramlibacter sp. AN1015 TaxID=3133428 RepID=UPI0040407AD9